MKGFHSRCWTPARCGTALHHWTSPMALLQPAYVKSPNCTVAVQWSAHLLRRLVFGSFDLAHVGVGWEEITGAFNKACIIGCGRSSQPTAGLQPFHWAQQRPAMMWIGQLSLLWWLGPEDTGNSIKPIYVLDVQRKRSYCKSAFWHLQTHDTKRDKWCYWGNKVLKDFFYKRKFQNKADGTCTKYCGIVSPDL